METNTTNALSAVKSAFDQKVDGNIRYRKLIENSHDGITLLDKDFNIIYRSNSAERIVGWKTVDRIRKNVTDLIHPDEQRQVKLDLYEIMKDPAQSKTCIFKSKHFDGHFLWLEGVFTNFLNDPDINAIVCNFRDISEKKKDEDLLQQTMEELLAYRYSLDESAIVAVTDHKGIIKHVNHNFCKISKYSEDELIGQDHRIINSCYHDKAYIRNLWVTIAGGKIWRGEFKNLAKDGSYYWVDTTIVPFLNEKGKPYQYLSVRWDITERKKTISALEESEKRYSDLFHLSPLPKWIYSIDTLRFLNVNEAAVKHYGYSRAEFLSMTISDIRPAEELHKMNKAIAHSIKHRSYHRGIFIHRKKNQEILYADVHSNCINYKGETAIVVLANDITERLKYIKAVEQQNEKLKEISWVQSHLVRAPLARIKGLIPLINDVKENIVEREKMCEYLLLAANELDEVIATITNKTDVGER
ncbi:MAG TPA: PAS domain-containing protein [Mucilaginibacter sp.]|jgi:PAS domain S-box-containing protein